MANSRVKKLSRKCGHPAADYKPGKNSECSVLRRKHASEKFSVSLSHSAVWNAIFRQKKKKEIKAGVFHTRAAAIFLNRIPQSESQYVRAMRLSLADYDSEPNEIRISHCSPFFRLCIFFLRVRSL